MKNFSSLSFAWGWRKRSLLFNLETPQTFVFPQEKESSAGETDAQSEGTRQNFCNNVQQTPTPNEGLGGGSSMTLALSKAPGKRMKLREWEQVL
ncbi:hypothetical protein BT69DRAFT_1280431, partial [Atractiella rhizophila]